VSSWRWGAAAAALLLSSACATTAPAADAPANRADPWEPFNRDIFAFNEAIDEALLRPAAETYRKVVPEPVRNGVGNLFGNFEDAWSSVNHLLQGKLQDGLDMGMRVATNTVFGLGGVIDVASDLGIERRSEDLGQTFGRWGVAPGPYLVVPIFGPRTLRDAIALPFDRAASLTSELPLGDGRVVLFALEAVHVRSELLAAGRLADQLAFDKYVFLRDAYLARRRSLVYDGDPPEEPADDEGARTPADPPPKAPARP
jgi:phospholipid-binding lipoprotein MlaA